jgi:hypothetical protein
MKGSTNMFTLAITVVVLSVLYGLAWHNEPARKPVLVGRSNKKLESHE